MAYDVFERVWDVVVAGGGLAGWAAAVTAARAGRSVALAAPRANLGWEITSAMDGWLDGERGALAEELRRRAADAGAAQGEQVSPPATEFILDEMAANAGVEVLLYATPLAPVVVDGRCLGVVVGGKSGQHTLRGRVVIDATDTAVLSRAADGQAAELVSGRRVMMLNGAAESLVAPIVLTGDDGIAIEVRPSVWSGEAAVLYDGGADPALADLRAPAVLETVRREVPVLAEAIVSFMGVAPMRAGRSEVEAAGEGVEALVLVAAPAGGAPADWIAAGERAGEQAAAAAETIDEAPAPDVEPGLLLAAPPHNRSDVVVVGGGTAGAIAAIAAAREGASTTLIEPTGYLGGIATGGGIHFYYHGVTGGIQDELDARTDELSAQFAGRHALRGFHPVAKRIALLEMAVAAGVKLVFDSTVMGVITEPAETTALAPAGATSRQVKVSAVVAAGPRGAEVFAASVVIDSTGDGDVAAMAGARFIMGRTGDGLLHSFSQSGGRLVPTDDGRLQMAVVNFDAGYVDPDDITDLTRGRRLGLGHLRLDQWSDELRWTYVSPHLGLRQGRQIVGDYQLTLADQIAGRRFDDVIAYAVSHYDNHAMDYENESDAAVIWVWLLGQWQKRIGCELPYRCLLPVGVEGLLVACRAVSITQDAHYQLRMQRDMQRIGEAAGLAAAMAVAGGVEPRAIDVSALQAKLADRGCLREEDRPAPAVIDADGADLTALLAPEAGADLWPLTVDVEKALPVLKKAIASDEPAVRFRAATVLAMARDPEAVGELTEAVRQRRDLKPEGNKAAPQWFASVVLLGRIGDASALPAITEVMADPQAPASMLIAAIRAAGRIGDPSAVSSIRQLLGREDLPVERALQFSMGPKAQVTENIKWEYDLAAAEALAAMGRPDETLIQPYLRDDRAYVRRYARRLMEQA